jgi:hypothetical protein
MTSTGCPCTRSLTYSWRRPSLQPTGLAGAEIVVACMSFYKMCMDPTDLIRPLESILGPGTAYHSLIDAGIGVVIYDGVKRSAQAWRGLQLGNEWKDWKLMRKNLEKSVPSQEKLETYQKFLQQRG